MPPFAYYLHTPWTNQFLGHENGKQLQVTSIKISKSKENKSIHRVDWWLNRSRVEADPLSSRQLRLCSKLIISIKALCRLLYSFCSIYRPMHVIRLRPIKISMRLKQSWYLSKLTIKRGKGKKKRAIKKIEIDSQKKKTNSKFLVCVHARKTKRLLNYFQLAESLVLNVGNVFFSHFQARKRLKKNLVQNAVFPKNWLTARG